MQNLRVGLLLNSNILYTPSKNIKCFHDSIPNLQLFQAMPANGSPCSSYECNTPPTSTFKSPSGEGMTFAVDPTYLGPHRLL